MTTARYYTPLGNDIHENGIKPDLVIEGGKKEKVNLPEPYDEDGQLFQAIKHLKDTKISNNN